MKARLHPHWIGGEAGYVYSVICEGKLLVERSRDPECDAAPALLAKGITGKLTLCDGKTGIPRTVINIEKAAKLRVADESRKGLRFRVHKGATEAHSPESSADAAVIQIHISSRLVASGHHVRSTCPRIR